MSDATFLLCLAMCTVGLGYAMYSDMNERSKRAMNAVVDSMRVGDEHRREHQRIASEVEDLKRRLQACEAKR